MEHLKYRKLKRRAKFKRFLTRNWLWIKLQRWSKRPYNINEREELIIEIVTQYLLDKASQLSIAPITGNRYIVSADEHISMILTPINIVLSTDTYYHDIRLGSDAVRVIYNKFDRIMESRSKRTESQINGNMMYSLRTIAEAAPKAINK
jgi:hypothetical protein